MLRMSCQNNHSNKMGYFLTFLVEFRDVHESMVNYSPEIDTIRLCALNK